MKGPLCSFLFTSLPGFVEQKKRVFFVNKKQTNSERSSGFPLVSFWCFIFFLVLFTVTTGSDVVDADGVALAAGALQFAARAVRPAVGAADRLQHRRRPRRRRRRRRRRGGGGGGAVQQQAQLVAALLHQRLALGRRHRLRLLSAVGGPRRKAKKKKELDLVSVRRHGNDDFARNART